MVDEQPDNDMRLLAIAYLEFFAKNDKASMRLLERDRRLIVRSVGAFGWFLMDAVVIPTKHGVGWADGWVEVDFRSRTDPAFAATLLRRNAYRRLARGRVVCTRHNLRKATCEVAAMLCMAYAAEAGLAQSVSAREAMLHTLHELRSRFGHASDANKSA
ncbi:hypothetical protein [Streptomyces anulatus]|uniref:hypothetical protein n=1 Tax=Streptomyces anulatus TaxID=1892 RepID=UPI003418CD34